MKKILVITMLLVTAIVVKAQTITITSFGKAENDLEITVRNRVYQSDKPYTDGNGDPCALIKITRADNMPVEMLKRLGAEVPGQVLHPKYVDNEGLYFYVTYTSDQLRIFDTQNRSQHRSDIYNLKKHFQYVASEGREGLDPNAVYEMTLKYSGGGDKDIPPEITEEFLDMTVEPEEALVSVDGTFLSTEGGTVGKLLPTGRHTYTVTADMYHEENGTFEITSKGKTVLNVKLRPNYGYLSLESNPSGAMVYINGKKEGTTPYKSERMKSGSYQLQLIKEMYSHKAETIIITDEQTTRKEVVLSADFAEVTVTTDPEADIYVNNEKKAKGSWSGRLGAGVYVMEARRTSHRTTKKSVTLVKGENKKIEIESPEPIYGNINVNSTPVLATIKIDGKEEGTTPQIVRKVLIGSHEVEISKEGCMTERRTVKVEEGKTSELEVVLETGREITVTSTPSGAEVYVDGKAEGKTPLKKTMSFGSHRVKVVNGKEEKEQTINVTENGSTRYDFEVTDKINGHEYVDLGLPSGLKWATCNVGAKSPSEYGDYYAWGETTTKTRYTEENSKTYNKKIGEIRGNESYDAARVNWGGTWRMPTKAEFEELLNKCTWKWTSRGGNNGYNVTGPNGNSIFLPAAGYRRGTSFYYAGSYGVYWSSTPLESNTRYAYGLYFDRGSYDTGWNYRDNGRSVRPVSE